MKIIYKLLSLEIILLSSLLSQSIEIPNEYIADNGIISIPIFIYDVSDDLQSLEIDLRYDENIIIAENSCFTLH